MKHKFPQLTPARANLLVFAAGWLLLVIGLALWYAPVGLAVGGAVLLSVAVFGGGPKA